MQGNRQGDYANVPLVFAQLYLSLYSQYLFFLSLIALYMSLNYDHVTGRTQTRPFEDESYWCSQQDANLCGANAHPTDELSLPRNGGGEQRG